MLDLHAFNCDNVWFFNVCAIKRKFFEIVYNIWVRLNITNENNKEHNKKWPYVPDHPYRMLITGGSGLGKTDALLNLIKKQDRDNLIDKIYLCAKDLNKLKYQLLIKKREDVGIKHLNDSKGFIEYS